MLPYHFSMVPLIPFPLHVQGGTVLHSKLADARDVKSVSIVEACSQVGSPVIVNCELQTDLPCSYSLKS